MTRVPLSTYSLQLLRFKDVIIIFPLVTPCMIVIQFSRGEKEHEDVDFFVDPMISIPMYGEACYRCIHATNRKHIRFQYGKEKTLVKNKNIHHLQKLCQY